ncbi:MAG: hypothetical protein V1668_00375 [Patescibacteria group bacterium]
MPSFTPGKVVNFPAGIDGENAKGTITSMSGNLALIESSASPGIFVRQVDGNNFFMPSRDQNSPHLGG